MDDKRKLEYLRLFENMISKMTFPDHFVREEFIDALRELSIFFRLSKGVTEYFRSVSDEKTGVGDVIIDYDEGPADVIAHQRRIVSAAGAVCRVTLYMSKDEKPLSEEEAAHLDVVARSLISFITRNRLATTVERLSFYDEDNFRNLRYFFRHIERLMDKNALFGNTLIVINCRQFSLINRDIGRAAGDIVLRRYFELFDDTLEDHGIICRVGGDNFAIICENNMVSEIIRLIEGVPVTYDEEHEKRVMLSSCAGVFTLPADISPEHPGEIFGPTYALSQEAKFEPENTILYMSRALSEEKERAAHVRHRFLEALEKKEFRAYYQPKVDVTTGRLAGAEALCRWYENGKLVPPGDFIPVLEQSMDICLLDFYMLEAVCHDIRKWMDEGKDIVRISVNLSRKNLIDADLLQRIVDLVDSYKVPHEYIEIELTETKTEVEFKRLKDVVTGLQRAGIKTAVDDFGVGYSSLNLIREIPWDVLKIDRCLLPVKGDAEEVTRLMFCHVASMAKNMGLECVAEGVETMEHIDLMRDNGCNIAQGFYFDPPLRIEEFEERLVNNVYELEK
ncbi:MAG: EAL domain-containing protein [Lachnospiraceae bacterium]|nr:EAL domain-containing protein [Lachnospiraceae bacterium]MBQ6258488.1 EAL domain-containing protein [Lachnospiraceae bacterium]